MGYSSNGRNNKLAGVEDSMITKTNEPIYRQNDGNYIITVDGNRYGVCDNNQHEPYTIEMVEAYLLAHPEALIPEPLPPEPTQEEKDAIERRRIISRLAEIDTLTIRPLRATMAGTQTKADTAKLAELEAEAEELRGQLA